MTTDDVDILTLPVLSPDHLPDLRPLTIGSPVAAHVTRCYDCHSTYIEATVIDGISIGWHVDHGNHHGPYEYFDCPDGWTIGAAVDMASTMARVRGFDHWVDVDAESGSGVGVAYFDRHGTIEPTD